MSGNIVYVRAECIYNDSRATKEITALCEAGYKVTVLAWDKSGISEKECAKAFYGLANLNFIFFHESVNGNLGFKNLHKLLKWFFWVKRQLSKAENVAAVHACDLDAGMGVIRYCRKQKTALIYDIFDYYIDAHHIPPFLVSAVENVEIGIINDAKVTIICTEERKEQIAKASPRKLIVIHNSPDVENTDPVPVQYDYAYCGNLCDERDIGSIFTDYPQNSDLRFCIAGHGDYRELAEKLMREHQNFSYFGPVSYSEVIKLEQASMCLSAIYDPSIRNHRLCAPNKFYEALALGKPIIVCRGTGIDKIVEENRIGIVINYDEKEFYSAIRKLKDDPLLCTEMGKRARAIYEDKYRWGTMKERLLKAYSEVVSD